MARQVYKITVLLRQLNRIKQNIINSTIEGPLLNKFMSSFIQT